MASNKTSLDELRIDRSESERRSPLGLVLLIIVLLACVGGGIAWWWLARPRVVQVRAFTVRETSSGGQRTLLNASGYVTPRREATVSSKVTGKVVEVLVEEGMRVKEGQILARLDTSNVEANLKLTQAQLDAARATLRETQVRIDEAELDLRRITDLAKGAVASQADLDRARAEAQSLNARLARQQVDVAVAERQVALWQQQMDDNIIRAPFAGVVVSKNAQPGEMISPMSAGGGFTRTGICTIVDMTSLEVDVDVNESYINRVQPSQAVEATLDSYPEWKIPAKVIAIVPTADRQKATVRVRIGFEKLDPRILPNMGVKVAFQAGDDAPARNLSVTIPKSAIQRRDGKDYVFVIREGRVERRAVTLGGSTGEEAVVLAGLSGGERIVSEGGANLAEGDRVDEAKR